VNGCHHRLLRDIFVITFIVDMELMRNLYLRFGLMAIIDEQVERGA
jgi:hypothetical protein